MSSDHLDNAIDEAVRGMMSVEPARGLRGRVMRGIAAPAPPRRPGWSRLALAAGMASCVAIVALLTLRGTPGPPELPPTGAADRTAHAHPAAPPAREPVVRHEGGVKRAPTPPRPVPYGPPAADTRLVSAASIIEANPGLVAIESLDAVHPIEVAALSNQAVQVTEIAISPIQLEPVRVDPLSSQPR